VVVTGIDSATGMVHLNDSGIDNGRDEQVPVAEFEQSWAASHNFTVITTQSQATPARPAHIGVLAHSAQTVDGSAIGYVSWPPQRACAG
jgi:hypothetical protein